MVVGVFGGWVDSIDVEVERDRPDAETFDTGLLLRLAQGDRRKIGITVGVSARLDPDLQLRVEQHERAFGGRIDHEGAPGEVAGALAPVERLRTVLEQPPHAPPRLAEIHVVDGGDHRPGVTDSIGGAQPGISESEQRRHRHPVDAIGRVPGG